MTAQDDALSKREGNIARMTSIPNEGMYRSVKTDLSVTEAVEVLRCEYLRTRGIYPDTEWKDGACRLSVDDCPLLEVVPCSGGLMIQYLTAAELAYDIGFILVTGLCCAPSQSHPDSAS